MAALNGALYEWVHHVPLAIKAGVDEKLIEALGYTEDQTGDNTQLILSTGKNDGWLSEKQYAVFMYTDDMTRNVKVSDMMFAEMKKHFTDREVVELTATVCLEKSWFEGL